MGKNDEYSLLFKIGGKINSDFSSSFSNAKKELESMKKSVDKCKKAWSNFGKDIGKLAIGAVGAIGAIGGAAFKLTDDVAAVGDEAAKTAAKFGMEAEGLQELRYAFGASGVGSDEFTTSIQMMRKNLTNMANDDNAAKKLEDFGLSAKKLFELQPEIAIERIADYMNQMESEAERSKLALIIWGNGTGAAMNAAMRGGSEGIQDLRRQARETGSILSNETAQQSEHYTDMKQRIGKTVEGVKTQFGSAFLPIFSNAFEESSGILQEYMPQIKLFAENLADGFIEALPKIQEIIESIGEFGRNIIDAGKEVVNFFGGFENLAKIVAGLLLAKTAVSGIIAVISTISTIVSIAMSPTLPLILGIVAGIAAVIAIGVLVVKNWDKIKAAFQTFGAKVLEIVENVKTFFSNGFETIKNVALTFVDTIGEYFTALVDTIGNIIGVIILPFELAFTAIRGLIDIFIAFFTDGFSGGIDKIGEIFGGIGDFATKAFDKIKNVFKPLKDFFDKLFGGVGKLIGGIADGIGNFFGGNKKGNEVAITGHADGGIFTRPHLATFAENAPRVPEAAIPVENTRRSFDLWKSVGKMAGFTEEKKQISNFMNTSEKNNYFSNKTRNTTKNNLLNFGINDKDFLSKTQSSRNNNADLHAPITMNFEINSNSANNFDRALKEEIRLLRRDFEKLVINAVAKAEKRAQRVAY